MYSPDKPDTGGSRLDPTARWLIYEKPFTGINMTENSHNKVRTEIPENSHLTKNIWGSLQSCKLDEVEAKLTSKIDEAIASVLQELLCSETINNRTLRHSSSFSLFTMVFNDAFALFSSFHLMTPSSLRTYCATRNMDYLCTLSAMHLYCCGHEMCTWNNSSKNSWMRAL